MAPIFIFVEKKENGKYEFSQEKLEELLKQVWQQGYEKGIQDKIPTINPIFVNPYISPTSVPPFTCETKITGTSEDYKLEEPQY